MWPLLFCALLVAGATSGAWGAEGERQRRVLMVHSFGSGAPPFTVLATAFESTIKRELGAAVDLDQVSLDMARYAQPDMEEVFAEFLAKRLSKGQPDLVVPIGAPAGQFVAKFRDRLFPRTPVIYSGMDKRVLTADALANNATFVGYSFEFKGLVEDMLQLDPETNNVVVILGATPLERYWAAAIREEFAPYAGRVKFTFVNDLSFEQMLDRVSKLPPHSFVLLVLLLRDASGVTHNPDEALARLRAVSRAPINGLYDHHVGLGVVGGRLLRIDLTGVESAHVAARILRGEPASNFPPRMMEPSGPLYDWRELRHWGISERRLPQGSTVMFRQRTAWERYRWHVIVALAVIVAQSMLILALLFHRRQRRRAELSYKKSQIEVQQKRAELAHFSRVAALGELSGTLAHEINQPLAAILGNASAAVRFLDVSEPDVQEVRAALCDIREDTNRAAEVILRLRRMLKRDTPELTNVDLNHVIRTVERMVHNDALLHGVTIELDLSRDLSPVKADAVQLQQVILNLMLNALSAMSEHALNGAERRLTLRTDSNNASEVLIEVRDSGTGIPAENLQSIFEPFITSKPDGLGMGLSICKSIVERHDGKIWASNNADRGATFSITLPASRA